MFEATVECCAPDLIKTAMIGKKSQPLSAPESDSSAPTRSLHASFSCNQRVRWTGVFFTLLSRKPFGHPVVSGVYMLCSHLRGVFSSDRRVTCSACGNAVRLCRTDYRGLKRCRRGGAHIDPRVTIHDRRVTALSWGYAFFCRWGDYPQILLTPCLVQG